jgi:uncharacterized protein (DUF433 family)
MKRFAGAPHLIREPRAPHEVLRDYPTYTVPEAALILAMSRTTLHRWVANHPFFVVSGNDAPQRLLSFKDLAQLYFLKFLRRQAHLSDTQARIVLDYAKQATGSRYPLLDENIKAWRHHAVWTRGSKDNRIALELFKPQGQYIFQHTVDMFASRIDRDRRGSLLRLYPWRLWTEGDVRRPVLIDPNILSGRPVITGTRIPIIVVAARRKKGETISGIAQDYGISQRRITESLRHLHLGLRKAA